MSNVDRKPTLVRRPSNRWIIFCLFGFVLCWPGAVNAQAQKESKSGKPNIILIMVDDLGAADLGCYGSKAIQTPNIDRLCRQGMKFTNAYAGHTVCAPSRCVLMTGLHTGHARIRANRGTAPLKDSDLTVAEVLKKEGYVTGGFGKWGLGTMGSAGAAEKQGFDEFFGYYHQVHAHTFYPPFLVENGKPFVLSGNAKNYGMKVDEIAGKKKWNYQRMKRLDPKGPAVKTKTEKGDRQFSHYAIFDRMKSFIKKNKDRPFFCYAPWTPPHAKYHLPAEDPAWKQYKDKPWSNSAKVHAAFTSMIDRHVGEVMALVKENGIADNTMIVFMSDNGGSHRFDGELDSCGKLRGFKRSLYEGGIRTPMIVHWPGKIVSGAVSNHITYSADFLPTLSEMAGASLPKGHKIDGLSFLPTLLGKKGQKTHQCLYWQSNIKRKEKEAVRKGDLKFVKNAKGNWEVYHLGKDPSESHDLAKSHQKEIQEVKHWIKENTTSE